MLVFLLAHHPSKKNKVATRTVVKTIWMIWDLPPSWHWHWQLVTKPGQLSSGTIMLVGGEATGRAGGRKSSLSQNGYGSYIPYAVICNSMQ